MGGGAVSATISGKRTSIRCARVSLITGSGCFGGPLRGRGSHLQRGFRTYGDWGPFPLVRVTGFSKKRQVFLPNSDLTQRNGLSSPDFSAWGRIPDEPGALGT